MIGKPPTTPAKPFDSAPGAKRTGYARIRSMKRLNPSGETFRVWYECGDCGNDVGLADRFCRWCGVEFWKPRPR